MNPGSGARNPRRCRVVHGDHLVAEQHAHSATERFVEVTRGGELREVEGDSEILERHLGAFHVL